MSAIAVHDIVQITDQAHPWFPCLLLVTEVKSWGIQGFAAIPQSNDGSTAPGQAFNRLRWEQIERIGPAVVIPAPYEDEESAP
jgi:hypothetical protein